MPQQCYHCDEPLAGAPLIESSVDGETRRFCCEGCRAVCELIHSEDLGAVYRFRTAAQPRARALSQAEERQLLLYDHELVQKRFVVPVSSSGDGDLREASLLIGGISCAACVWLLEHHLAQQTGVHQFSINHSTHQARLVWDAGQQRLSSLLKAILELGYSASPWHADEADKQRQRESRIALIRLCVAGLGAMQSMMLAVPLYFGFIDSVSDTFETFFRWFSLLVATPVVLFSARPFFTNALRDLKTRHLSMDVPVALAIGLAYTASTLVTFFGGEEVYFESVCMFTFFLSFGRYVEMQARHRAGTSGHRTDQAQPEVANRVTESGEEVVSVYDLHPGDRVRLYPGDTIPVDGTVLSDSATVNEAALTGEYVPVSRRNGERVFAGTVNGDQPLLMSMSKAGADTRLSGILRIMERAQSERPPIARLADRVAAYFVGTLLVVAPLIGALWWWAGSDHAFDIMLSVLVVTCPCALSLATPTALTSATNALRDRGFIPARGHTLESMKAVDTIVFDKTGTLTTGNLSLVRTQTLADWGPEACLALASGLERYSEHPVAQALGETANHTITVEDVVNHAGGGLTGHYQGQRVVIGHREFIVEQTGQVLETALEADPDLMSVFLCVDETAVARFDLDDQARADARQTIETLNRRGYQTIMLSGDRSAHVDRIAEEVGIQSWAGELSPEDKLRRLERLRDDGRRVMMVGDGLNDLPIMAGASVSVALGRAADLTRLKADAILLNETLWTIAEALTIAHRTRRVIRQNLSWALGYNISALPLAAAGLVPPWLAAIGMSLSSLIVVFNALRLGRDPDTVTPSNSPARISLATSSNQGRT